MQCIPPFALQISLDGAQPKLAAFRDQAFDDHLARPPRIKKSSIRLKNSPRHILQINLRPALLHLLLREFSKANSRLAQLRQ